MCTAYNIIEKKIIIVNYIVMTVYIIKTLVLNVVLHKGYKTRLSHLPIHVYIESPHKSTITGQ